MVSYLVQVPAASVDLRGRFQGRNGCASVQEGSGGSGCEHM